LDLAELLREHTPWLLDRDDISTVPDPILLLPRY
jgi:hypothetical protein